MLISLVFHVFHLTTPLSSVRHAAMHMHDQGRDGEILKKVPRTTINGPGAALGDAKPRRHAAFPRARAGRSAVGRALPPIPQSPLSTSSTTHQVTLRMFSPSIETIASVSLLMIWRFCSPLNTSLITRT